MDINTINTAIHVKKSEIYDLMVARERLAQIQAQKTQELTKLIEQLEQAKQAPKGNPELDKLPIQGKGLLQT